MKSFFGMIPVNEISIERQFQTGYNATALIQAGEKGWTVVFADQSTYYKNTQTTSEDNFNTAKDYLLKYFPNATEITPIVKEMVVQPKFWSMVDLPTMTVYINGDT